MKIAGPQEVQHLKKIIPKIRGTNRPHKGVFFRARGPINRLYFVIYFEVVVKRKMDLSQRSMCSVYIHYVYRAVE